jgi:HTH-type transcriptional regulator/antitoxin HigA
MDIRPIRNKRDHERALRRVEDLWSAREGSSEYDELGVLATLVEAYEREHFPVDLPDPIEAIKFRLEQQGKGDADLVGVIGTRPRVWEVLHRRRPLSLNMIRRLHKTLGIPANVLIAPVRSNNRTKEAKRGSGTRSRVVRLKRTA